MVCFHSSFGLVVRGGQIISESCLSGKQNEYIIKAYIKLA